MCASGEGLSAGGGHLEHEHHEGLRCHPGIGSMEVYMSRRDDKKTSYNQKKDGIISADPGSNR